MENGLRDTLQFSSSSYLSFAEGLSKLVHFQLVEPIVSIIVSVQIPYTKTWPCLESEILAMNSVLVTCQTWEVQMAA